MAMERTEKNSLIVDLYELTMAAAYFQNRVQSVATFELFIRELPRERSYLVAGGIESALDYLETLRFAADEVEFLRTQPAFRTVQPEFFDFLEKFRFTGQVHAVPEGTLVFAEEPLVRVTAPILEAQIVETYLLSVIHFDTLIASKAARVVEAARGRSVLEFGTRRAHGPEAGVRAAKSAFVGGCEATSNVLAGRLYGIPLAGTAAHSWSMVFPTEREGFERLLDVFPETAILLVDTYDAIQGTEVAAALGRKLKGIRLDSGDMAKTSHAVRRILDTHGLKETRIVASGDLNEHKIDALLEQGAPIDVFAVGTQLATSSDVPALGVVYKLVEVERDGKFAPKAKFSDQKVSHPGRKQVFRFSRGGRFTEDLIACEGEVFPEASPLLQPVMSDGRRVGTKTDVHENRTRALAGLSQLPEGCKRLENPVPYPVRKSPALERLLEEVRRRYLGRAAGRTIGP